MNEIDLLSMTASSNLPSLLMKHSLTVISYSAPSPSIPDIIVSSGRIAADSLVSSFFSIRSVHDFTTSPFASLNVNVRLFASILPSEAAYCERSNFAFFSNAFSILTSKS